MSSLALKEKAQFEKLFGMTTGYVLDYSDASFGNLLAEFDIDIHSEKYSERGTSKANKFREFWKIETDDIVAKVLMTLTEEVEAVIESAPPAPPGHVSKYADRKALIVPCKEIVQRLLSRGINLNDIRATADEYNANYLTGQVKRIELAVNHDPELAIGTAKEIIETCCRTILRERGMPVEGSPEISKLTKATLKELKLVPEGIPSEARGGDVIRRILQNLGAIGNGLAELRGLYGTGHGKDGQSTGLTARHAKLAANASVALANFLFETHREVK